MQRLLLVVVSVAVVLECAGAGVAGATEPQAGAGWVAVKLPGVDPQARGINNRGQIVGVSDVEGGSYGPDDRPYHAVLWEKGKMRDLGTLGGQSSAANAINDRGQIVGWSDTKPKIKGSHEVMHAFLWENGRMRDLGTLPGPHPDSEAVAVNQRGQVVGRTNLYEGSSHAFLWEKGRMRDLGMGESGATSVNSRGQIVGWGAQHVFLWEKGRVRYLGIGSDFGGAAINDLGQVVTSGTGLLWANGKTTTLCAPAAHCSANAINNRGQIVGDRAGHAALFHGGTASELPTPGWTESYAADINENGVIVGTSSGYALTYGAWMWTPKPGA